MDYKIAFSRVAAICHDSEHQQHCAAYQLKDEHVSFVGYEVHHEAHSESCDERIYNVAQCSPESCYQSVETPFVQGALQTQNAHRSHGGGGYYAYEHSFYEDF